MTHLCWTCILSSAWIFHKHKRMGKGKKEVHLQCLWFGNAVFFLLILNWMCCSLRYNSLIRVGRVERVWASREIRVFFSSWVYRLHSLSHAAQGRIVFFSLPIVISGERLSVRYERREPSAVCFPAFPDPRPCQLLSMPLPNNRYTAPGTFLTPGRRGWRGVGNALGTQR